MVKEIIAEYRPLFHSDKFNICADETFDLGKGKSRAYCEEKGVGNAYVEYVSQLCSYVKTLGCTPMMWGDIIVKYPDLLSQIPEDTIFLNWWYEADVTDEDTKCFAKAGVPFYNCPGVSGWSRLVNDNQNAYENIRRMAAYAKEIKCFIEAIENDTDTPLGVMDELQPVLMGLAAKKSLEEHRPVKISEITV